MRKNKYIKMNDHELISMIKSGPPKAEPAFTEIYQRYSQQVYIYIYRILNNREAAEDIHQETFLKFYQNVSKHKTGSIKGFLITIARNICLNYKRDKKITLDINDLQISGSANSENEYDKKELLQLIDMAVELLDHDDKELLVLRIYNGFNYNEISEISGLTIDNARTKVYRAKQKIKDILKPYIKDLNDLFENNNNNNKIL